MLKSLYFFITSFIASLNSKKKEMKFVTWNIFFSIQRTCCKICSMTNGNCYSECEELAQANNDTTEMEVHQDDRA